MCANGKLHSGKYRVLPHRPVAVREELRRVNWRCSQLKLPGQQTVLPPIYCTYLQSFLCGYSRCTFRLTQTSSSDMDSRSRDRRQQAFFLEYNCLELLIIQSTQNAVLTEGRKWCKLKKVSYMYQLLHPALFYFDPQFPKWSACGIILPAVHTTPITPVRCLHNSPHPFQEHKRTAVSQCVRNAHTLDLVRLVWRGVRRRKGSSYLRQTTVSRFSMLLL
jgi:hypothetical protein